VADRRLFARIYGRVQGVGFRYFARELGRSMNLSGYVRNLPGGEVEVVAEGNEGLLAKYLGALRVGPTRAHVEKVDATWGEPTGEFYGFVAKA
jgi:acylphosphatase